MKAVFLDLDTMGGGLDLAPLCDVVPDLTLYDASTPQQIAERISEADIVLTNKINLSDELLRSARNLKYIGLTATGTDNVDLDSAARHGVTVCNIRAYCTESVVEHVFGVLLAIAHSLHRYPATVAAGEWQRSHDPFLLLHPIRELSAMTMGIVGYGSLGQGVAKIARSFGMDVLVSARPGAAGVRANRVSFEKVLQRADVISLHCPLNDATRNLFASEQFRRMKNSAILINTARGGLVDSQALVDALSTGEIYAAAVDVLPVEPPADGDPLLDYRGNNLIVTPHIAWATNEARQNAVNQLAANVKAFLEGKAVNRIV